MAPLPHHDLSYIWLRYQVDGYNDGIVHSYEQRLEMIWVRPVNRVHMLDFVGLTDGMRQTLGDRLSMVYAGDDGETFTCKMSDTEMGLDVPDTLCFLLGGARRRMTWRQFILALGLHSEEEMVEPGDFLGPDPSYVHIRDPVRRLCQRMIACSIFSRGQGAKKYLFHLADGRKSEARLSGGHFIIRLAAHFGLVGDQGLRGLSVVVSELPAAMAGAPAVDKGAPAADKGAQAVPAPVQAPQPPPPALQPRPISQMIDRLEEEVCEMRQSVVGLRGVVESSITEQTRVSTWMISCMTQLMDVSGRSYQAFDSTLVDSS
ncbi:hypothetical protein Tco_1415308 [Tanacetum coccineum]